MREPILRPQQPERRPNVDFDHNGQTNLFKYIAGLNPLDPTSRFTLSIAAVPGQPVQKNLTFSPRFADRTYTIKAKSDLCRVALKTGNLRANKTGQE